MKYKLEKIQEGYGFKIKNPEGKEIKEAQLLTEVANMLAELKEDLLK